MPYGTVNADTIQSSVTGVSLGAGNGTGFKNRMINGGMQVAQRGTSFTSASTTTYCVDRTYLAISTSGTWTLTQDTDVPAGYGFANSFKAVCTSATASPNQLRISQSIEGYNVSDSNYGTATARPYTLSFWIKTNKTGTYSASFETATSGRYYTTNFTVSASNTWEFKTIVISGDTSGTLNTTTGVGLTLSIWVGAGSSLTGAGTQNAWTTNATYSNIAQGQTAQLADTVSNYFNITGLQFEVGSVATGFDFRPYGTELALCQRYYYKVKADSIANSFGIGYCTSTTTTQGVTFFPVTMRTAPSALEQTGTATDYRVSSATGAITCSAVPTIASSTGSTFSIGTVFTVASGLVAGNGALNQSINSTAYLGWSAEL